MKRNIQKLLTCICIAAAVTTATAGYWEYTWKNGSAGEYWVGLWRASLNVGGTIYFKNGKVVADHLFPCNFCNEP